MEHEIVDLFIENFSPRGFGLATFNNSLVEVAHAIPGDRVRVEMKRKTRRVKKGKLLELLEGSPDRITPSCQHAAICGGCCWQSMDYAAQLKKKEEWIRHLFPQAPIQPIIPCENPWRYRNKMEFSFSENRAGQRFFGLMIAHAEPYVFNVEECLIAPAWMSDMLRRVRAWWEASTLHAYHPPSDSGSLRYLTLRESVYSRQKMAVLNVSGCPDFALSQEQLSRFVEAAGEAGAFLRIHQTKKGVPTRFYEMHLAGPSFLIERLNLASGPLDLKISPASFSQPNPKQAEKLYDTALGYLGEPALVYDLYCGTGALGLAAARRAKRVIGIELSVDAVVDAEENAKLNHVENIHFLNGDAGKMLTQLQSDEIPNAVIVDPPRAGLDPATLQHLKDLKPQKIVYVSCNPITQADNIQKLTEAGYQIASMQPIDQFPHTAHIENIACLTR
jgi:23S rRNA (uracil1939-C5)-methyltransferase